MARTRGQLEDYVRHKTLGQYNVFRPKLCTAPFASRHLRLEFDTRPVRNLLARGSCQLAPLTSPRVRLAPPAPVVRHPPGARFARPGFVSVRLPNFASSLPRATCAWSSTE